MLYIDYQVLDNQASETVASHWEILLFLAWADQMGTVSIHFSHLQLACNPQMHIKPHFLF